jgi:hypothetical protein
MTRLQRGAERGWNIRILDGWKEYEKENKNVKVKEKLKTNKRDTQN